MLVGSDFNVDVGSNMDKVFQIVVRARGVGKSPTGGGGGGGGNFAVGTFLPGGKNLRRNDLHSVNTEHQLKSQLA